MYNYKAKNMGTSTVTMTSANTEYSFSVPKGCRFLTIQLADDTVAYRYAWTTGVVASGGHKVQAGVICREFENDSNAVATTLYFASSTASQTMVVSYFVDETA